MDAPLPPRWCLRTWLPRRAALGFFLFRLFLLLCRTDGQGPSRSPQDGHSCLGVLTPDSPGQALGGQGLPGCAVHQLLPVEPQFPCL